MHVRLLLTAALLVATCLAPGAGAAAGMPIKGSCCCDHGAEAEQAPDAPPALRGVCCCSLDAPPVGVPRAARSAPPATRDPLPPASPAAAAFAPPPAPPAAAATTVAAVARGSPRAWTLLHQHVALLR